MIDEGADIPAETRQKLTALIRLKAPEEASAQGPAEDWVDGRLLEQSVRGDALFALAVRIHRQGESVIEKRHLTRTFYDLVMALPEPHRTDALVQITRTSEQEAAYDKERGESQEPIP